MRRACVFLTIAGLALCSIAYELILAQGLTLFLHNTVLRYSVTIGLYMFALGFGSLAAEGREAGAPLIRLQQIELLLSVAGGFSVIFLFLFEAFAGAGLAFTVIAHALILVIGFLSGFEMPLLMVLSGRGKAESVSEHVVLAFNYAGAFAGTLVFAFVFYPRAGLIASALVVGLMNAVIGLALPVIYKEEKADSYIWILQMVVFGLLAYYFWQEQAMGEYFINRYLQG